MRQPLHPRTIAFWFAITCMLTASIGMVTYWETHQLVGSFDSVSESHFTLEKLQLIQSLMEAAESSVDAYVITGNNERLAGYRTARYAIPGHLKKVTGLLATHPRQKKTLERLSWFLSTHLTFLHHVVDVRQNDGYEAAAKWIAAEDYSSTRGEMEHLLAEIQKQETSVVRARSTSTSQHSSQTQVVLIFAAVMSLGFLALVFSLLNRETGQRRIVEDTNQTLETFLRSLVERIPYMVLVKEADNLRLTLVNKAATEWFSRSEEDLLGSNEYDLRPHEEADQAMEKDREALQNGRPVDIPEESFIRGGKDTRILHTQKIPIPDAQGNPAYLLSISEDITEQKKAERMLQLSRDTAVQSERLKSEFIRNMSHEIRTPISVFLGMNSLLLGTNLTEEQKMLATKSHRAADNLSKLTKDILDFSKIETGTFSLELQDMNVRTNVESVLSMWNEQAKAKGVSLVSSIPKDIPATLVGDSVRLRQVLTQLIGNAVKFTPSGEIIVRVKTTRTNDEQVWLTYEVSDTGIGMPEDVQKHLFEPFRQGDGSATRRYGGTGLGLAISKRIVDLMGGEIGFENTSAKGSTFWFTIPFKKQGAANAIVKAESPAWAQSRVLVIDDNEMVRQLLRHQLSNWAMASEGVASGEMALELLRREQQLGRPFAIALFDMHLADMDGIAFARAVKKEAALAGTKLLVMIHGGPPLDPASSAALGIAGWVAKPPKAEALHECLASLIETPKHPDQKHVA